ncbi:MAG: 5'-3' exonuclease H3TH domain-containing protein [Arsenophonus sp.]|nr:MAG: 5'-3' exonuclease H3TH domain-containing protein [Arsenophonus sp.]
MDGSFYLYRAFYAFPKLTNSFGDPSGAIYGVLKMLNSLIKKYKSENLILVFDAKGKKFRNKLFSKYKAHRPPMPQDLSKQILPLYKILYYLGYPIFIIPNVEADDVIGTISNQFSNKKYSVYISTGDKDMEQLINNNIKIINTITKNIIDFKIIMNKYGIQPKLIIDLIALMGDKTDGIPGVCGIGKKTALNLIQKIGNINTIYNNLIKIKQLNFYHSDIIIQKLLKNKNNAFLSYQLAKIKTNLNIKIKYKKLKKRKTNQKKLLNLLNYYKIKNFFK